MIAAGAALAAQTVTPPAPQTTTPAPPTGQTVTATQPATTPAGAGGQVVRSAGGGTFQVAAASATTTTLDLPLPDSGVVPITVIRAGGAPATTFTVTVSGFQDAAGAPVDATLATTANPQAASSVVSGITAEAGVTQLTLRIRPVPNAGVVGGVLTITADSTGSWRVNLTRGGKPTATLVVDNPLVVRALTCGWLGCGAGQGEATVRVWEKGHAWPLTNVAVRLEQIAKTGADFDGPHHLPATLNPRLDADGKSTADDKSKKAADLWSAPSANDPAREIPATGQGLIRFGIGDLDPGEYNATVRVSAANSLPDDSQKVTFQITVRHPVLWALLVLGAGLLVSLVGTKWLAVLRRRVEIESTISQLNAPWLRQEPPTAAVVWALANLRLIREGVRSSMLSIPESVNTRLESVKQIVAVLRAIHDIRTMLAVAPVERNMPPFVAARAGALLDGVVRRCNEPPLDAGVVAGLGEQLKSLQTWFGPSSWEAPYWTDLAPAIRALLQDVQPEDTATKAAQDALKALRDALMPLVAENAPPPANAVQLERQYAALKVLWERRDSAEFDELVTAHTTLRPDDVFRIADDRAWERLQAAAAAGQVAIELVTAHPEALEPFTLAVVPADDRLAATFLFRHRLQYEWRVERAGDTGTGARLPSFSTPFVLEQRTLQPIVSQYAPYPMTLAASVTIRRIATNVPPVDCASCELMVDSSESLGIFSSFSGLDVASTAAAGLVAAITGLSTFYFASPTFGSPKDYVALALWALAFDQAKNGIVQLSTPQNSELTTKN
jgi:hypothetical protein